LSKVAAISPARRVAFEILLAVERGKAHSDELLRGKAIDALMPVNRNLATALVLGILRWQIRLDHEVRSFLKRPNAKLDPEVRIALRMGAFQLLFMERIPAHAAIDESVELTKHAGHRFAAGMVNAVLRSLARAEARLVELTENSSAELALARAHPTWMVERWVEFYGLDAARAVCRHGQEQPAVVVRVGSREAEDELFRAGVELTSGELLGAARFAVAGDVGATMAFEEGRVRIQDEGSQLIGELAACAGGESSQKVDSILDCCAAPGGKTLILAERNPQAHVVACEASPRRLAELKKRLAAYAERVECRLADAQDLMEDSEFDIALADVPCSGTGTLGRNPEIRHRLCAGDLVRHAERQRAILKAALRAVRPGGYVVYSTCSLEPEENEQVVAGVLKEMQNARQVSLALSIERLRSNDVLTQGGLERLQKCITPEGALRLLPGVLKTDGFFAAILERTA
jgi:16S rRNA (cytosine967-C5)-methyltransferase